MLSLAPMNSALSGDERTRRRCGDTGMGASRTLGTGPPRVITGPWPSLPAAALFHQISNICLQNLSLSLRSDILRIVYTQVSFKSMKLCFLFLDTVVCLGITYVACVSAFCDLRKTLHPKLCQSVQMLCQTSVQKHGKSRMKQNNNCPH